MEDVGTDSLPRGVGVMRSAPVFLIATRLRTTARKSRLVLCERVGLLYEESVFSSEVVVVLLVHVCYVRTVPSNHESDARRAFA